MSEVQNLHVDGHRDPVFAADPVASRLLEAPDSVTLVFGELAGTSAVVGRIEEEGNKVVFHDVVLSHAAHLAVVNVLPFSRLFTKFCARKNGRTLYSNYDLVVEGGDISAVHEVPYIYRRVLFRKKLTQSE